jgi:hypothetical protein
MITRPQTEDYAWRKKTRQSLHPASNYISAWYVSNLANGSGIADSVYSCIGGRDGIERGLDG